MHMSSANPGGRPPGLPGGDVGEYKGMESLLCPWVGENSRDCFKINELGRGNSRNFCRGLDMASKGFGMRMC